MKTPIIAACMLTATAAWAETPVLTVYTYDSFIPDWGPGPLVEAAFEQTCACDLQFVAAGDGAELLARIRLEGARSIADVVLGLDANLTAAALDTGLFAMHGQDTSVLTLPVLWDDPVFLPFDWGYFAFVYDTAIVPQPPASFADLIASDLKIIIQDPRSSTPGLGLLLWVKAVFGNEAPEIWAGLSDHIVTVTKGWSEAYGLFLEGEADMVLSYTTSPAYHLIAENNPGYGAAHFSDGHYMQIEVAAKLATSPQPDLADAFLAFLTTDAFQAIIPTTNWMYPAKTPDAGLPEGFDTLIIPETAHVFTGKQAQDARKEALAEWLVELSK